MGKKSKTTQSRALNLGESSKNPPNVMASDDGDDNNNILLETFNPFTTLTITLHCLGGLRGWRYLFVNEASGLRMDSMHSVLVSNVRQSSTLLLLSYFIYTARLLCSEV